MLALLFLSLIVATPAAAADRAIGLGSFDRVRVEGPYEVTIATGISPAARISGDADAVAAIDLRIDGTALVVRAGGNGWGERPGARGSGEPVRIMLATPLLATATSSAGARLAIGAMRGDRVDLTVTGSGAIAVESVETADLRATVIGAGGMTLAGRAAKARLLVTGPGSIDAARVAAGDLVVRQDGTGEVKAQARYSAQVGNSGVGRVAIAGPAKCVVRPATGGPVTCEGGR